MTKRWALAVSPGRRRRGSLCVRLQLGGDAVEEGGSGETIESDDGAHRGVRNATSILSIKGESTSMRGHAAQDRVAEIEGGDCARVKDLKAAYFFLGGCLSCADVVPSEGRRLYGMECGWPIKKCVHAHQGKQSHWKSSTCARK